jgi:hypothetical protein
MGRVERSCRSQSPQNCLFSSHEPPPANRKFRLAKDLKKNAAS